MKAQAKKKATKQRGAASKTKRRAPAGAGTNRKRNPKARIWACPRCNRKWDLDDLPNECECGKKVPASAHARAENPRKKRTRNSDDDGLDNVMKAYEDFHGRPAKAVTSKEQTLLFRKDFAKCGRLLDLGVWLDEDKFFLLKPKGVDVVTTGDGGSLYFQGGDQELPLEALGLAEYMPKDYVKIGEVQTIGYAARKGFHNFERRDYEHEFAEEGGEFPTLNYDVINKLFFLTGGSYQVKPEGIVN